MNNIERQDVGPKSGNQYDDSFYSHVYNTNVNLGMNEQRLIWTRYSGFLVLQGLIINTLRVKESTSDVVIITCLVGIICSVVWHILNFSGWLNQNFWFSKAAGFNFTSLRISMPTDWWVNNRSLKPTGKIYNIAQFVPISFILLYGSASIHPLKEITVSMPSFVSYLIASACVVVAFLVFIIVERFEFQNRRSVEDDRPLS